MKKQSTILFAKVNHHTLADLTKEVKETLVAGFTRPQQKAFTAADLWNIQRQRKITVQRRFGF